MRRTNDRHPALSARIASFLRRRAEPASSRMLAELFLRSSAVSEEMGTKLLRPLMEPAGATYLEGSGWKLRRSESAAGITARNVVAAAVDRVSGRIALADASGAEPGDLDGATVVVLNPGRDTPALRAWLAERGRSQPASIVSLRRLMRGVAKIPRGADLSAFCSALGVRWLDTEESRGEARVMAACADEAVSRGTHDEQPEDPAPRLPAGITHEMLAAVPRAPGVYRFYDESGALIYVGKSADLRRRVSSYFATGASLRPRRFYSRIHRLEYDVLGSELEALLREARQIARRSPAGNIQLQVHERGRSYQASRSCAVLLPRAGGRGVAVIVTRNGRYLGHATIGPRGGGLARAGRLLGWAVCSRSGRGVEPAPTDPDSEILASWLARHGDSVSRLELDRFTKASEAARALLDAARQILREPGPAVFR